MLTGRVWSVQPPAAAPSLWPTLLCRLLFCLSSSSTFPPLWYRHKQHFSLFAFLFLSISSRSDWRGTLCRNVTASSLLKRRQKCLCVVESRRTFPIEGLLWVKKCISFIFSSDSEAEQSESLLHYSYHPPMRPFASSARLHLRGLAGCGEWSGAERSDTGLEITGSFHFVLSISNQRDKQGKNYWDWPVQISVYYRYWYMFYFALRFC